MAGRNEAEEVFDQCLVRLRRGETEEACLAAVPRLASDLAPLLATASSLLTLAAAAPNPAPALARIRARLLRMAGQHRSAPHDAPGIR